MSGLGDLKHVNLINSTEVVLQIANGQTEAPQDYIYVTMDPC